MHTQKLDPAPDQRRTQLRIGRRKLLTGFGAAAVAGAFSGPMPALASHDFRSINPAPQPIPGGVESGLPPDHPLAFIHWFLPGPTNATTPVLGLPGFGLDVEPSLITDYRGFTAYAVLAGEARGSDGKNYAVEFDVRVMEGTYHAADGSQHHGAFGFF